MYIREIIVTPALMGMAGYGVPTGAYHNVPNLFVWMGHAVFLPVRNINEGSRATASGTSIHKFPDEMS